MYRYFILIILGLISTSTSAQTIKYITESGFEVNKDQARFYQEIYVDSIENNSVLIKKYKINGNLIEIGYFDKNDLKKRNGITRKYDENGVLMYIKTYKANMLNGELIGYYESSQIRRKDFYRNDSLIGGQCYTPSGADTTYFPMQILPTFKGGNYLDVRYFIVKNLKYPYEAYSKGIEGDVYINFCINSKSELCDIRIEKSDNEIFNKESIQVLKNSEKYWRAGYEEGKLAEISFTLPVFYRLK